MPQVYKRDTERATKTPLDVMQRAANKVESGKALRAIANYFNIDKMTLNRFIAKRRTNPTAVTGYMLLLRNRITFSHQKWRRT